MKAIVILAQKNKIVRAKDLAKKMNCRQSSVNYALKKLKKSGLIKHERYGHIKLTKKGENVGRQIHMKFNYLSNFFHRILGVESAQAHRVACAMEHCINNEMKKRINNLLAFYRCEEKLNREWVKRQKAYLLDSQSKHDL